MERQQSSDSEEASEHEKHQQKRPLQVLNWILALKREQEEECMSVNMKKKRWRRSWDKIMATSNRKPVQRAPSSPSLRIRVRSFPSTLHLQMNRILVHRQMSSQEEMVARMTVPTCHLIKAEKHACAGQYTWTRKYSRRWRTKSRTMSVPFVWMTLRRKSWQLWTDALTSTAMTAF